MKADSLRLAPEVSGKESSQPTGQKAGGWRGGASQYAVKAKGFLPKSGIERRFFGHQVNILPTHTVAGYFITCTV